MVVACSGLCWPRARTDERLPIALPPRTSVWTKRQLLLKLKFLGIQMLSDQPGDQRALLEAHYSAVVVKTAEVVRREQDGDLYRWNIRHDGADITRLTWL